MKRLCGIASLLAVACVGSSVLAQSIGVSFVEGDGPGGDDPRDEQYLLDFDIAGLPGYEANNWNNAYLTIPQPMDLMRSSDGTDSGVDLDFIATNPWGDWMVDLLDPDGILARGNMDDGETSPGVGCDILVSNIQYANYTVVLYLSSDYHDEDGVAYINGAYGEYLVDGVGQTGGSTDGFDYIGGWVEGHNVLVYEGVSGPSCSIQAPQRDGDIRGSIAGFQIIESEATCYADCNGDGVVNTQDFICFLGLWAAGDLAADCNGDNVINTQDFICFLGLWAAGC
jgi:hypothetical protein